MHRTGRSNKKQKSEAPNAVEYTCLFCGLRGHRNFENVWVVSTAVCKRKALWPFGLRNVWWLVQRVVNGLTYFWPCSVCRSKTNILSYQNKNYSWLFQAFSLAVGGAYCFVPWQKFLYVLVNVIPLIGPDWLPWRNEGQFVGRTDVFLFAFWLVFLKWDFGPFWKTISSTNVSFDVRWVKGRVPQGGKGGGFECHRQL